MISATNHSRYESPLTGRYASPEMSFNFSDARRFTTWRKLWYTLAKCQLALGMQGVTQEAVAQMSEHIEDIDYDIAQAEEKRRRHDVMAHIHTFGLAAPLAAKIIHLGATSCYVTDNAELIMTRDGLDLLIGKLAPLVSVLRDFCMKYKDIPCLGYTHFQPAQLTTVGKRASMWLQNLVTDLESFSRGESFIQKAVTGRTTGTQASFLSLFNGDHVKVIALERMVTEESGFTKTYFVTGQTYSRKVDLDVLSTLASFGATAHKICTDVRLLAHLNELEEPFESDQIGSSAMVYFFEYCSEEKAYKKNPMRSERVCGLARHLMTLVANAQQTASVQWLERTLDDSSNRRITIPESFLTADIVMSLLINIFSGAVVHPMVIARRVRQELPFMATESVIMHMVKRGGDRQHSHEKIRIMSHEAAARIKETGCDNDLIARIVEDSFFAPILGDLDEILDAVTYIGRAPEQVVEFVEAEVDPLLKRFATIIDSAKSVEIIV